ncbi:pseudouridine synthase [Halofilum ochraceum]|uniref:pseudouridine synthase n=1 Tax=Halofilum ochraceum TaxID=1611323 RepID=UPI0008D97DB5|nr:pseudouridine synthase [Halofilum ochraceum]
MSRVILFNKPFGTVCRFGAETGRYTLGDWLDIPRVYPAGRLDRDSEGLVVLTDDGGLAHRITHPKRKLTKTYWVQVEGAPDAQALAALRAGVALREATTRPARARSMTAPESLWERDPPIRYRARIPTTWLELELREGRNRQVRRMTATVGHPTLRLIRVAVGPWALDSLQPGEWREATVPPTLSPRGTRRRQT